MEPLQPQLELLMERYTLVMRFYCIVIRLVSPGLCKHEVEYLGDPQTPTIKVSRKDIAVALSQVLLFKLNIMTSCFIEAFWWYNGVRHFVFFT